MIQSKSNQNLTKKHKSTILISLLFLYICAILTIIWLVWPSITGFKGMTLWSWMEPVIIPASLALGVWWLNKSAKETEQKIETLRQNNTQIIETNRLQKEKQQSYVNNIKELLLKHHLIDADPLNTSDPRCTIARTLTLTVLPELTGEQKGSILLFLYESKLIEQTPLIDMKGFDLSTVSYPSIIKFKNCNLSNTNMKKAVLLPETSIKNSNCQSIKLEKSKLSGIIFYLSDFTDTDMNGSDLTNANIVSTIFRRVTLSNAKLNNANIRFTDLDQARLDNTNFNNATIIETNFGAGDLTYASFDHAALTNVNMRGRNIAKTSFRGSTLVNVNLFNCTGTPNLTNIASAINVILPSGKRHYSDSDLKKDSKAIIAQIQKLNSDGQELLNSKRYKLAFTNFSEAFTVSEKHLGYNDYLTATCIDNLGKAKYKLEHLEDANQYYYQALDIRQKTLGENHPDIAQSLNHIGELLQSTGKGAVARPLYERALAILETSLGADHPSTKTVRDNLAAL